MATGPVEYIVVAFPGNQFTGEIAPALAQLESSGTIRIIDLAFVTKDAEGNMQAMELGDLDAEAAAGFDKLAADGGRLLSDEDLQAAAEELEPNSSAALLVWENAWASELTEAIRNSGGELLDYDRIPAEVVQAAEEWAAAN
jgi:uncharacterized membrane protein